MTIQVDWTALDHLHTTVLWEGLLSSGGGFDRRCLHYSILHEYTTMSRASLPSREINRETNRQTEALYSSNKVHLKLIKIVHKKTPANLKTPS